MNGLFYVEANEAGPWTSTERATSRDQMSGQSCGPISAGRWCSPVPGSLSFGRGNQRPTSIWVPAIYAVASVITFVTYAADKSRAGTGDRRVPERTCTSWRLVGGWPRRLVAQRYFRHKTLKRRFQVIFRSSCWQCRVAAGGATPLHSDAP